MDAARGFAERTPEIRGALRVDSRRIVSTRTGATLEVLAADAASAYGLRPHLVIADEVWR